MQRWECEGDNIWGVAILIFLAMATAAVLIYFCQSQVVIPNREERTRRAKAADKAENAYLTAVRDANQKEDERLAAAGAGEEDKEQTCSEACEAACKAAEAAREEWAQAEARVGMKVPEAPSATRSGPRCRCRRQYGTRGRCHPLWSHRLGRRTSKDGRRCASRWRSR